LLLGPFPIGEAESEARMLPAVVCV
jgi:hypothetical protein